MKEINEDSTHAMVITFLNEELGESSYYLRKRNANFSYFILNNPGVAKTVYLSKVLGHEVNNEATAVCYQSYHILDDIGQQQEIERRRQREETNVRSKTGGLLSLTPSFLFLS